MKNIFGQKKKVCKGCLKTKPMSEFTRSKNSRNKVSGMTSKCCVCLIKQINSDLDHGLINEKEHIALIGKINRREAV
jgi:hypothetical protein